MMYEFSHVPFRFGKSDIVAFMGAHTIGRTHMENTEIEGQWTEQNHRFTNQL